MKRVSNPLTVIAIFAGLAESISGLIVGLTGNDQVVKYFLVGFPVLLVILFFGTLNFNSRVLYSPSDFKDDRNYLESLDHQTKSHAKLKSNIQELKELIEPLVNGGSGKKDKLIAVREKLGELEHTNNSQENARRFIAFKEEYQNEVLNHIKNRLQNSKDTPLSITDIEKNSSFSESEIKLALDYLENEWTVNYNKETKGYVLEQYK